ncbi:MAG TPA: DUF4124 domain-containing protein [Burkholderiales bacterium]|nr:DUF4124 domain-containing protein [Burkholderiales bacterium]
MRSVILMVLLGMSHLVFGDIYECMEPSGAKLFTSDPKEAKAKGCKAMNLGPPNTVSTTKPQPQPGKAASQPTPTNFPKVDQDTQKQRDSDRRRLLEQELANEEKLLAQAKKELAEQESVRLGSEFNYQRVLNRLEPYKKQVALHESNVANLKREISGIR